MGQALNEAVPDKCSSRQLVAHHATVDQERLPEEQPKYGRYTPFISSRRG
jgi:hypothetical protein